MNGTGNEESQHKDRKLTAAERQRRALELRAQGWGYDRIAAKLGYRSRSGPWRAVNRALAEVRVEAVNEMRTLENQRLDELWAGLWVRAAIMGDPPSASTALRVSESRRKLWGADAPDRLEITRLLESKEALELRAALWDALAECPRCQARVDSVLGGRASE